MFLKRFNLEIPTLLKTVKQKVEDLNYDKVTVFFKRINIKDCMVFNETTELKISTNLR